LTARLLAAEDGRVVAVCSAVACVLVLAAAPAALGANYQITASASSASFSPKSLIVAPGDSVTISYAGGELAHNSHYEDRAAGCPFDATMDPWSCPRTFSALGDYAFYCDEHFTMTGTVLVREPQPGDPPPPDPTPPDPGTPDPGTPDPGTPSDPGTPPSDVAPPLVTLRGATAQRVIRRRVVVKVRTDEASTLTATGRVRLSTAARVFRLRKVTRSTSGGELVTLKLKLSRKALAAVRRALGRSRKVRASIRITATDAAGNRTVSTRRIALKR
jgi:plastocyanin